ncbi:MAG TPA: OB-fold nucleic acid binding domain-containing protein, partial [Anaerolineales bacterium]|nr:OB-fold nucleic acid binding domain-containing protein [Anaerolineales bacterium]
HPLTPYQPTFAKIVSYFSGQLGEAQHEEKVRVAGLITAVRPYMTKTNKPMGFVTLEDIQGNIELVLFPRTWEKLREQLKVGQIVIVEGKVDLNSTPPKVLVESIRTEIKILESLDEAPEMNEPPLAKTAPVPLASTARQPGQTTHVQKNVSPKPTVPPPVRTPGKNIAEHPAAYSAKAEWDDLPPPPDNFPDDWDTQWQPTFENAEIAARPEAVGRDTQSVSTNMPLRDLVSDAVDKAKEDVAESNDNKWEQVEAVHEALAAQPVASLPNETLSRPPSLYVPLAREEKDKDHKPQQITLTLRSTGDKDWDKRKIKTIFGTLISFHGRDRFSFQIFENGSGHLIDFPNDTTRVCPEMLERLKKLMGQESWRVEEITFQ